jgi:multiple sugar transport system ATP-binding protein
MAEKLVIRDVVKRFGSEVAVAGVSLEIDAHSFTTLLGPSGCGKTTLLRMIAGLEDASSGYIGVGARVLYSGAEEINVPCKDRGMGLVFQSYALWPHMTVFDNVAYGLRQRRHSKRDIQQRVERMLDIVKLQGLGKRFPSELSGGQQQRVSMARMLVLEPAILLMDEPLSNLDAQLRMNMQAELKRIHKDTGITIVYVTHDQTEAMTLSTHIAVMQSGRVLQYGPPQEIYDRGANLFVAEFMGHPSPNLIDASVRHDGSARMLDATGDLAVELAPHLAGATPLGQEVVLAVRPEGIQVRTSMEPGFSPARVYATLHTGSDMYLNLEHNGLMLLARVDRRMPVQMDDRVFFRIASGSYNLYDKESTRIIAA